MPPLLCSEFRIFISVWLYNRTYAHTILSDTPSGMTYVVEPRVQSGERGAGVDCRAEVAEGASPGRVKGVHLVGHWLWGWGLVGTKTSAISQREAQSGRVGT